MPLLMNESLRQQVLAELGRVCGRLAALLAGHNLRLADVQLPQERDPRVTPEERLRFQKAYLNAVLRRFDEGSYGSCSSCDSPIPRVELEELPWATICLSCAGHKVALPAGPLPEPAFHLLHLPEAVALDCHGRQVA